MLHIHRPSMMDSIFRQSIRFCSSTKRSQVIATRYQQKQLFGPVVRKGEPNGQAMIDDADDTSVSYMKYTAVNADTSSEYHWVIRQQKSKHIKVYKSKSNSNEIDHLGHNRLAPKLANAANIPAIVSPTKQRANNNIDHISKNLSPASEQSVILSAKNLLNEFVISTRNANETAIKREIPFDEHRLKSIRTYSIMSDRSTETQLNDILYDKRLPSITKVLQATMSQSTRNALQRWKAAKIAELGEAGFNQYQQETFEIGKQFHMAIDTYLMHGCEPADGDSLVSKLWQSLGAPLKQLEPNPVLIEQQIIHPDLWYKGIIDNVSYIDNELCALEWKTSDKIKSTIFQTYDAPIQLCAYMGALNVDPRYDIKVKTGYVVVAYKNGETAHMFRLTDSDIRKYWSLWLERLHEYWIRLRDGTLPDPI